MAALVWFYVIAFAFTAAFTALVPISLAFAFPALFGPALGAVIVTAATDGRAGVADLLRRTGRWRVGLRWYVVAILVSETVTLAAAALPLAFGERGRVAHAPVSALSLALFVTVVGEEIGWRGFALPRLLERWRALPASLILGVLWAVWHVPTFFLQGTAQAHFPLPAYVIYTSALSVLFTWLLFRTQGSVFFATFFHGCINTFVFTSSANPVTLHWAQAGAYALGALLVARMTGPPFRRR